MMVLPAGKEACHAVEEAARQEEKRRPYHEEVFGQIQLTSYILKKKL